MRRDVEFSSGDGACAAWLYEPAGGEAYSIIVMAHGLGAIRDMRLDAYAERFVAAGYACLVFDYRHCGSSPGEPRQLLDVKLQQEDWRAALAFARALPRTDPARVILWGTSFSGGHVVHVAARDRGISALIAQGLFTDGIASALVMNPVSSTKLTALAIADVAGARLGRKPILVPIAGAKGTASLMTADDVMDGYLGQVPPGAPFRNEAAARIVFGILGYRPGRDIKRVRCPALYCVSESDSVAPAKATLKYAAQAPDGETMRVPEGHFAIYTGDVFERVVARQLAFLRAKVPT